MSELMKSAAIITAPWLGWKILRELYVPKAFQWYAGLNKPSWRPPVWSFGPVYTFLYPSMGYASHLIWKAGNETFEGKYGNALMFYAGSLALNLSFRDVDGISRSRDIPRYPGIKKSRT